MLHGGINLG
jgi:hypothetical protein